jgi:hypothetical protein
MTTHLHTMAGQEHLAELERSAAERRMFLPLQGSTEHTNERPDDLRGARRFTRRMESLRQAA